MEQELNFIWRNWEAINFTILGLAIIAVIISLYSKTDRRKDKIVNILFILFIPFLGVLYFYSRLAFKLISRKHKPAMVDVE